MALFFSLSMPLRLTAGQPTEQLRATVDALFAALSAPRPTAAPGPELRERLGRLIAARFDFAEMARRALGAHWPALTMAEQREFVEAFAALLEKSYGHALYTYSGEKLTYSSETQQGDDAEVHTTAVIKSGDATSVNYKLHRIDDEWKVYDVVIESVSLVDNYRSQFNRVIAASSFQALVRKMKQG